MNSPVKRSDAIIVIPANPPWVILFRKVKKFSPILLFSIGALMLLASMAKPSKPYNKAIPIVNFNVEDKVPVETAVDNVDPIPDRDEGVSDVPTVKEMPLSKESKKNLAKPVKSSELFSITTQNYIRNYSKIAVSEMKKYGIPASITLAQGLIESRAGTSKLAVNANNHFGMKCMSKNCKKGHCVNMTDDTHKDFFKKFPNAWASFRAHSELLSSGRYKKLHRHGRDYRAWAYGLKSVGYATDRTYAEKLIGIIERYDLHKYDR